MLVKTCVLGWKLFHLFERGEGVKYGVGQDPYCYPNSDVLVNKLNIRDEDALAAAEIEFSTLRFKSYRSAISNIEDFTLEHLQRLHLHLFQDVYDWAGELRAGRGRCESRS